MKGLPTLTQKHWDFANHITNNTVVGTPTWIGKIERDGKAGKTIPRLLVVGKYNIFTVKAGAMTGALKIAKQAHIYDLVQMGHVEGQDNAIELIFMRDSTPLWEIKFSSTPSASIEQSVGLSVLFTIQCARMQISYKFPPNMLHYMPERSIGMLTEMPRPWERMMPAQAHVETYHATCTYEDHPVRDEVITHIFTELQGLSYKTEEEGFEGKTMDLTTCFKGCTSPYFNNKDVNAICSVLAHSPWFKTVVAEDMSLTASGTMVLFAAIANKQVVDKVIMRNMHLTAKKVSSIMAVGGSVKILDLSNNPLGDAGMAGLASAFVPEEFDEDDYTCALDELYLSKCGIQAGPGFQTLCGNILATTMASSLKIFDLSTNIIGTKGSESLALFLGMAQSIQNLNLTNTQADLKIVLGALALNNRLWKSLKFLHLSHNPFCKEAAQNLGGFLKKSEVIDTLSLVNMSTLTSVCYSDILSSLFSNSTDLPNNLLLDLSRNKFTHADVASVSTHIEGSPRFPISRLIMDDCSLGVEGMHLIAQSLVERKPGTLKVFSAARNMSPGFFTSAGTIHAAQTAMCRLVKSSEPLVDLDLSGDDSHKFGAHIVPVVEALKSNKTLKVVNFSNHKAGDKLAEALGEVLAVNCTLNEVWFDKNSTTVEGFNTLMSKIEDNKSLVSLGPPLRDFARAEKTAKEELSKVREGLDAIFSKNIAAGAGIDSELTGIIVGEDGMRHQRAYTQVIQRQRTKSIGTAGLEETVKVADGDEDDEDDIQGSVEKNEGTGGEAKLDQVDVNDDDDDEDDDDNGNNDGDKDDNADDDVTLGDGSVEGFARSSMEIKLHLLELAQAEAKDHKVEMEAKLKEVEEKQHKLVEEAKREAEEAAKNELRAQVETEMSEKLKSEVAAAKATAIKEAEEAANKLQDELKKNQEQVQELTANAEIERQKLEQTLNEKAEKELKEQMLILKKATGMAEAELQWAIESSSGNAFLMAEEKKAYHELEYSKLMFEMSKLDKLMYLLKNPNIGRALVSASKAIAEERILKKEDGGGDGEPPGVPALQKTLSARAPPPFLAQLKKGGGDGGGDDAPARPSPFGGGNPFAAAAAAKGLGGGGGIGGLPKGPMGGAGFLSQLTGGARSGLKSKQVTIKSSREKLQKLLVGEQKQVDAIPFKLKDFNVIVDALKAVLDADDDNFASVAKEQNEHLKAKDKELKESLLKVQRLNVNHEGQIEIWNERMNTAPERAAEMAKREEAWVAKQQETNLQCLKIMRSYIPMDIEKLSVKQILEKVKAEGGQCTYALAERLKSKKLLHWIVMHKDDIARENFLVGANVSAFKNLGDYDVVELRAVYACLPATFELDNTPGRVGAKLEWKNGLITKLKEMSAQQAGETVPAGWDPVKEEEKFEKLKPLKPADERNPAYYYLDESGMKEKIAHFEVIEQRLDGLKKRCTVLEGEEGGSGGLVSEMKAEADAALEDYRSEYLQQEYGKDVLKSLRDEAAKEYKKVVDELGFLKTGDKGRITGKGLKLKIYNLEQSIENASPNKKECLEEFGLVRAQKLQVPDLEADAAVLTGILEIAYAKVLEDFCSTEFNGRGCLIGGVFDPMPEPKKKERTAFKKLSDEEEARQRKLDMEKAMAARGQGGGASVKDGILGDKNNGGEVGVVGGGGLGKVKPSESMRAMLESQHGGGTKAKPKEKAPVERREPKSKALKARASAVVMGAGEGGNGLDKVAAGALADGTPREDRLGEIKARPPNPMLAGIKARGAPAASAPPRPPNPMLAAIQARGPARPPNPMLAAIQARGPPRPPSLAAAIAKRGGADAPPRPENPMVAALKKKQAAQLAERNAQGAEGVGGGFEIGVVNYKP
eukprot:CAMPEP_0197571044 /NCGR_PEP_ID=MMETSP1320-20131121/41752_1 /TAXON_ID=91990 /ORGANISM="Bolidomonas sp., Strain RCC2347" /LENGTH=1853 /DNA_ID=CAMNT_0043133525 /DNA_START=185 /DNA_END=5743 /DNA_ORIENTATION=-